MSEALDREETAPERRRLGWKAALGMLAFQAAGVAIATFPMIRRFRSALPEAYDSLQHLWLLRWYKTCLLEGRSPLLCPDLQYPVGAPLGGFSPLHIQALLYAPLSIAIGNDVVCYNILWAFGLLMTGMGTSLLIWELLGDRPCAAFGGLLAMLSGPMLIHAHGHLELIYVGSFPLFLLAWIRFVDRPGWGRLVTSALAYVLLAMCAAYFMVFAIFPAVLYVVWRGVAAGRWGVWPWVRGRAGWFLGFVAISMPFLIVLFAGHILTMSQGHSHARSRVEFDRYGAPLWSYLSPTTAHLLGSLFPPRLAAAMDRYRGEGTSYLGIVTIGLMAYAALRRAGIRRSAYLWSAFALLVVLSMGSSCKVGTLELSLPSSWLWSVFPVFRLTRVPARFNLFAGVLAGTLAASGLCHLLRRLPGIKSRAATFAVLTAVAVADLATVPFWNLPMPVMPGCYAFLKQRDPGATILEVPFFGSGGSYLNATCTYWQALHRLRTSAGYSGHRNPFQDQAIGFESPLASGAFALGDDLKGQTHSVCPLDPKEFLWLSLAVNRFDYVVLHQWQGSVPEQPVPLDGMKALLREAKIYEDEGSIVYERSRLRTPRRPLVMILEDLQLRHPWHGRPNRVLPSRARIAVYNPEPDQDLSLILDAAALRNARSVRLLKGSTVLARWDVLPGRYQSHITAPFRLPAGVHELTLESEGWKPHYQDPRGIDSREERPYSLRVSLVDIESASVAPQVAGRKLGDRPAQGTRVR